MSYTSAHATPASPGNHRTAFGTLAVLLALAFGAAWMLLEDLATERHLAHVRQDVDQRLAALRDRVGAEIRGDLLALRGLVSVIHLHPDLDQAQFERAAQPLFDGTTNLRNIAGAPDMVIRLMTPLAGNEKAVGLDYRRTPSQASAAEWARLARGIVVAGPLDLVQGGQGLIARVPVYLPQPDGGERFWGLVSAVIDIDKLYDASGLRDPDLPIEVAIRGRDASGSAGPVFFGRSEVFDGPAAVQDIELPLGSWHMAAAPRGGWPSSAPDAGPLRLGLTLAALLVFGALAMAQRAARQSSRAHAHAQAAERQVTSLIENAPDAMLIIDDVGRVRMANAQAERLLGWRRDELLGKTVEALVPERYRGEHGELRGGFFARALRREINPAAELVALHRDGHEIAVEISLSPLPSDHEATVCAVVRDVTERRQAERRLRLSERRVRTIADNMPALIAQIDADGRFVFANATYRDWYGFEPETMLGQSMDTLFAGATHAPLRDRTVRALARGERQRFEAFDGERHVRVTCVPERADDGRVAGLFVLAQDITDLKAIEARLTELARADHLTGLLNRRSFDEELMRALARARRAGTSLSLMYVDVDHFKSVNDGLGHAAGDAVLQTFAQRLRRAVRTTDTVARLGGDEFVVILEPVRDADAARAVADKIAQTMRAPIDTPEGSTQVTASIGVAWLDASDVEACSEAVLQAAADTALYEAKDGGRNRHVLRHVAVARSTSG